MSHDTAVVYGLNDRGVIAPGYKADFNVIDFDNLSLRRPEMVFDLPGGARRLIQKSTGYDATIVSGEVVMQNGNWKCRAHHEHGDPGNGSPGHVVIVSGSRALPKGCSNYRLWLT